MWERETTRYVMKTNFIRHRNWCCNCTQFFLNFCQATAVFTSYTLGTLIAYTVIASQSSNSSDINAQEIVIIALYVIRHVSCCNKSCADLRWCVSKSSSCGLFCIFTVALVISHTHLILSGQTTVESLQIRHMKGKEDRTLAKGFSWWQSGYVF